MSLSDLAISLSAALRIALTSLSSVMLFVLAVRDRNRSDVFGVSQFRLLLTVLNAPSRGIAWLVGLNREPSFISNVDIDTYNSREVRSMRTTLLGFVPAVSAIAIATPVVPAFSAQVVVDTPVGGVRVGHDRERYSDYDHPRYRSYARGDCRTITIRRDDGSMRRIRRCD